MGTALSGNQHTGRSPTWTCRWWLATRRTSPGANAGAMDSVVTTMTGHGVSAQSETAFHAMKHAAVTCIVARTLFMAERVAGPGPHWGLCIVQRDLYLHRRRRVEQGLVQESFCHLFRP